MPRGSSPGCARGAGSGGTTGRLSAPIVLRDAGGGPAAEGAADLLVTAGVVAAVPTAAAGLNDWSDTAGTGDSGRPGARRAEHHGAESVPGLAGRAPGDGGAAARRWPWPGWDAGAGRHRTGRWGPLQGR